VVIAPGNHDYYSAKSIWARLKFPDNVFVFRSDAVKCLELEELGVRVFGAAYTDRSCRPLLEGFRAERYPGTLNLLCLHAEVDGKDSRYCPVSSAQLAGSGLDYAAFGHVHKASGLLYAGETCYSWPGCPEGRGFDETGDRTVNLVEIDRESGRTELKLLSIARRRYEILQADISENEPLLAIHALLPENTEKDIYRILLTGETDTAPDTAALQNSLEGLFFHLQVRDETRPRRDIWEKAGSDTLRGIFLTKCRERYDAASTEEEKALVELAVRYGLAAMENREVV
jgi:DNA repair exonuclease SbcCD nuclease subunit